MFTQGTVAPGFERVADAFAANFEEGHELGASFAVILEGETVVELWGGFKDRGKGQVWERDTLAPVFSTTKGVAALVVARCVELGLLDYEAPVAAVWPEFAASGKGHVTLAQLLSHQAGLPGSRIRSIRRSGSIRRPAPPRWLNWNRYGRPARAAATTR